MNPLTNTKNLQKLNQKEIELGLAGSTSSWHNAYKDSAWIFVGGMPYDLSEGDVIAVFSQYGEIVNINMVRDKLSGKQKGYAFICYEDQRSTILAVDNLNAIKILNRTIRVDHVMNYKVPQIKDDVDELTKKIRMEGCGPEVRVEKLMKKLKKAKEGDKNEKKKKKSKAAEESDTDEKPELKTEKESEAEESSLASKSSPHTNKKERGKESGDKTFSHPRVPEHVDTSAPDKLRKDYVSVESSNVSVNESKKLNDESRSYTRSGESKSVRSSERHQEWKEYHQQKKRQVGEDGKHEEHEHDASKPTKYNKSHFEEDESKQKRFKDDDLPRNERIPGESSRRRRRRSESDDERKVKSSRCHNLDGDHRRSSKAHCESDSHEAHRHKKDRADYSRKEGSPRKSRL